MFIKDTLSFLSKKIRRDQIREVSKRVATITQKPQLLIVCDMIWCSLKYGSIFTEYENVNFYEKSRKKRTEYFSTFQEFAVHRKLNGSDVRQIFHNKINFLNKFSDFISRDWITEDSSNDEIMRFLAGKTRVVLKGATGDSGKQVRVLDMDETMTPQKLLRIMKENNYNLAEECIFNHRDIAALNESSLNTVRIVSMHLNGVTDFLYAGIRVGAKGAKLDNLSQGGAVANIDINTGKISSEFYHNKSAYHGDISDKKESKVGYQIPFWDELKEFVIKASFVVDDVCLVAWDVCITETGLQFIEGNESFGCEIMQLDNSISGLKPKLQAFINNNGCKIKL